MALKVGRESQQGDRLLFRKVDPGQRADWPDYFRETTGALAPFERCDCFRSREHSFGPIENRFFYEPRVDVRLTYVQWNGGSKDNEARGTWWPAPGSTPADGAGPDAPGGSRRAAWKATESIFFQDRLSELDAWAPISHVVLNLGHHLKSPLPGRWFEQAFASLRCGIPRARLHWATTTSCPKSLANAKHQRVPRPGGSIASPEVQRLCEQQRAVWRAMQAAQFAGASLHAFNGTSEPDASCKWLIDGIVQPFCSRSYHRWESLR